MFKGIVLAAGSVITVSFLLQVGTSDGYMRYVHCFLACLSAFAMGMCTNAEFTVIKDEPED